MKRPDPFQSVTFRLTAWHLLLFTAVSLAVMWLAEARLSSILRARTDHDLKEDLVELRADFDSDGLERLQEAFDREAKSNGPENILLALVRRDGESDASSEDEPWEGVVLPPAGALEMPSGEFTVSTVKHPTEEGGARVAALRLPGDRWLCICHTLSEEHEMRAIFHGVLPLALLGMLVTGCVMAWWLTGTAMAGVVRVTRMASTMGREHLGDRVTVGKEGQEITDLAVAFNGMLQRIDLLVRSLREVTDNLAHDLRSPLTRLRGTAETALTTDAGLAEHKELASSVVEECDALVCMLNTMLEIAQSDAGGLSLDTQEINLTELLSRTHELYRPAAEDCGLQLQYASPEGSILIRCDRTRLLRVLVNLLDNAMKYTPSGGVITLSLARKDDLVLISVADTGPGISEADQLRIFDRFYRADESRSKPGIGLGLSLCQAIAQALGGGITVTSKPGEGSTFTLRLPLRNDIPR